MYLFNCYTMMQVENFIDIILFLKIVHDRAIFLTSFNLHFQHLFLFIGVNIIYGCIIVMLHYEGGSFKTKLHLMEKKQLFVPANIFSFEDSSCFMKKNLIIYPTVDFLKSAIVTHTRKCVCLIFFNFCFRFQDQRQCLAVFLFIIFNLCWLQCNPSFF